MKKVVFLAFMILSSYGIVIAQSKESVKSEKDFFKHVLAGKIYFLEKEVDIDTLTWNPHPTFKGVYLKNLVTEKDSNSRLAYHIVKVEPNCMLDTHVHETKIETHEVINGSGTMYLNDKEISYSVGCICIIPANTPHKVVAGKEGLYLLAKFTPAF